MTKPHEHLKVTTAKMGVRVPRPPSFLLPSCPHSLFAPISINTEPSAHLMKSRVILTGLS